MEDLPPAIQIVRRASKGYGNEAELKPPLKNLKKGIDKSVGMVYTIDKLRES